jgi:hypothetical protein
MSDFYEGPYTPEELFEIQGRISGMPGFWIPIRPVVNSQQTGPVYQVKVKYSETYGTAPAEEHYWDLLRSIPIQGGIAVLSAIVNLLAASPRQEREVHAILEQRFVRPELRSVIRQRINEGRAFSVLFSHPAALLALAHLITFGNDDTAVPNPETDEDRYRIGDLFLFANEFFDYDPTLTAELTDPQLMQVTLPTWDILNRRDLASTVSRIYCVLDDALTSTSADVVDLRQATFELQQPTVHKIPIIDFVAVIFGIFSWGQSTLRHKPGLVFDTRELVRHFPSAQGALDAVVEARAKTVVQFREVLLEAFGASGSGYEDFRQQLRERRFLMTGLNPFRRFPLLLLDEYHVAIVDMQFLSELLSVGLYWTIHDDLPVSRRERFRELWGKVFERYVCSMLAHYYPPMSQLLHVDVQYDDKQVDALLDFAETVIVFEIKSSLLTEPAKRSGQLDLLIPDIDRKFVRNERGNPKAVIQLASACAAVRDGRINTSRAMARIYPVLVTDEIGAEAPGFNSYLNEKFRHDLKDSNGVMPLTVMSIAELEELLPYVRESKLSWQALLDRRFDGPNDVRGLSVHQTLYDALDNPNEPVPRNEFIGPRFEEIWKNIQGLYRS